jgi:hypothetical protein
MNPTQEKSCFSPVPIFVFAFRPWDLERRIHSIWNDAERHTKSKALRVPRCCLGGNARASNLGVGTPTRQAFFPSLVVHGPRFEHSTRAYYPWNAALRRELGKAMVVRKPDAVVV